MEFAVIEEYREPLRAIHPEFSSVESIKTGSSRVFLYYGVSL